MFAMRSSPPAIIRSRSLEHVGDLRGIDGMFRIGSSSLSDGDVGLWKVELFLNGVSLLLGDEVSRSDESRGNEAF